MTLLVYCFAKAFIIELSLTFFRQFYYIPFAKFSLKNNFKLPQYRIYKKGRHEWDYYDHYRSVLTSKARESKEKLFPHYFFMRSLLHFRLDFLQNHLPSKWYCINLLSWINYSFVSLSFFNSRLESTC